MTAGRPWSSGGTSTLEMQLQTELLLRYGVLVWTDLAISIHTRLKALSSLYVGFINPIKLIAYI